MLYGMAKLRGTGPWWDGLIIRVLIITMTQKLLLHKAKIITKIKCSFAIALWMGLDERIDLTCWILRELLMSELDGVAKLGKIILIILTSQHLITWVKSDIFTLTWREYWMSF